MPRTGGDAEPATAFADGFGRWFPLSGPAIPPPGRAGPATPVALGRLGALEVRLASGPSEVRRAQRLRYEVFFEEMAAVPGPLTRLTRRDADAFDAICDHLVVLDHAVAAKAFRSPRPKVVGTYRLLRREVAEAHGGFYSAAEFALEPWLAARPHARLLELGRSCVLASYRTRKTVELLWQGLWAYAHGHRVEVMFGCASLPGTDLRTLAPQLAFLHRHARSPEPWRVRALPDRSIPMDLVPPALLDPRAAFKALPPLVKGYLRLGATFGDGAVIDRTFGTTDVFAVMPIEAIRARYILHFGPAANRHPA